jgi:hypothetical protein
VIIVRTFCFISTKSYRLRRSSSSAHILKNVKPVGKCSRRRKNYPAFSIDPGLFIPPRIPSAIASCGRRKGRAQRIHLDSNQLADVSPQPDCFVLIGKI